MWIIPAHVNVCTTFYMYTYLNIKANKICCVSRYCTYTFCNNKVVFEICLYMNTGVVLRYLFFWTMIQVDVILNYYRIHYPLFMANVPFGFSLCCFKYHYTIESDEKKNTFIMCTLSLQKWKYTYPACMVLKLIWIVKVCKGT